MKWGAKASFIRIDFLPSAVHGKTSSSQITMDVYERFHTRRLTSCTAHRCAQTSLSLRRPFGNGTAACRRRREMYTGLYGLVQTYRRFAVSIGRRESQHYLSFFLTIDQYTVELQRYPNFHRYRYFISALVRSLKWKTLTQMLNCL